MLFDYLGLAGGTIEEQAQAFLVKAKTTGAEGQQWAQESIMRFLDDQKQRVRKGELAAGTLKNIYRPIKMFCEMHDLNAINWKRISMSLPRARKESNDRAPILTEIRKLVEFPDRRIKPLVYVMCSSGIRVGSWDYLQWKHVIPKTNDKGEVIAAKLIVYAGEPEEYYSFISPEAFNALKEYMSFRAAHGEKITGDSWVMRDKWKTIEERRKEREENQGGNGKAGGVNGLATCPKKLSSGGVRKILLRAWITQDIRSALPTTTTTTTKGAVIRRHDFKEAHGFRKYFKSNTENAGMLHANIEYLMGHISGLQGAYYKPLEQNALQDYLRAIDKLTINGDNLTLQKQVTELAERNEEQNYIIKGKLAEKEKEAEQTKKALADVETRQRQFEEQLLANLEKYQKEILKMVTPFIEGEMGIKDEGEKRREMIRALIQAPSTAGFIKEQFLQEEGQDGEEEKKGESGSIES